MLRSQLYVPANDEKKIRKSASLDCDSVVFDLEDAVPIDEKASARNILKRLLSELDWEQMELGVRVNKGSSGYFSEDIEMLKKEYKISFIVLPKAEEDLSVLYQNTGKSIEPLVETARGLLRVEEIASTSGVFAISYGAADFASTLEGKTKAYLDNAYVKTKIVVAARAYGILPVDNVFFDLADLEGFRREATQSKELGYAGKQVIHPSQIEIANVVFSPSAEEIEEAEMIVRAYEKGAIEKTGALRIDDQLIDAVHYRQAKRLLGSIRGKD